MIIQVLATTLVVLVYQIAVAATPKKLFDIVLQGVQRGGRVSNVVDKILRESLEPAILIDPTIDILAMGFLGNDALNSNQHSGSLVYNAKEKRIMSFEEYRGVKTTRSATSTYFVEIQE